MLWQRPTVSTLEVDMSSNELGANQSKSKIMLSARISKFQTYIDAYSKKNGYELAQNTVLAFGEGKIEMNLTRVQKSLIQECINHPARWLKYLGMDILVELTMAFPDLAPLWESISDSKSASQRVLVASFLRHSQVPVGMSVQLLSKLVEDRSAKVREFSIEAIRGRRLQPLFDQYRHAFPKLRP
jgi:hypothetical protein